MTRLGIIIMIMPGVFRVNNTINETFPIHFHGQYRTLSYTRWEDWAIVRSCISISTLTLVLNRLNI